MVWLVSIASIVYIAALCVVLFGVRLASWLKEPAQLAKIPVELALSASSTAALSAS